MYAHAVVGGTFDGLHKGHEAFLSRVFAEARHVTIGLTSEAYVRRFKKDKRPITPFSKRYQALTKWLRSHNVAERTTIVPLDNRWGPAVLGDEFDAIGVTQHNKHVAGEINTIRVERGLPALAMIEVPLVPAEDQLPISSTRVREGEIDRAGHLVMPDSLRPELQKPLGRILVGELVKRTLAKNRDNILIAVGDVATQTLFLCGVKPALAIIDLKVERRPFQTLAAYKFPKHYQMVFVKSGPGYISRTAIAAIEAWSKTIRERKRTVLVVEGEEDLLTIPAIIHAPLRSYVYYGQPSIQSDQYSNPTNTPMKNIQEGLVEVVVSPRAKQNAEALLARFQ